MNRITGTWALGAAVVAATCAGAASQPEGPPLLRLVDTIVLKDVRGRIDHLAFDSVSQRLFVAALGNDTVEVLDTLGGKALQSLSGFHEPQGMAFVPEPRSIAVANGESGTLQLVDAETYETRWVVAVGDDADNVRYDATAKRIFVAAVGGLVAVDPASGRVGLRMPISGHPESFQLAAKGATVFANLPGNSAIVVGDRSSMTVTARWAVPCGANYPMALDTEAQRLFVGCRRPASVAIFDPSSGRSVGSVATVGDTDDLFYDPERGRLYVIGGDGAVDVFVRQADMLRRAARIPTREGARTGLWVGSQSRLYVAVPARAGKPAEIRVFLAQQE
jgi:DNA-binding beta-propeller fold protein YncE